jgi:phage terminase large subunit
MPSDVEIIKHWRKSPLNFIKDVWGLIPQPLIHAVSPELDWHFYKPEHFEKFVKGKHLTWQQWLIFRAVERGIRFEAPRRISVASGHGIGKSTTESMLKLWFLGSFTDPQVPCTANTGDQLSDVLWKESKKWLNKMPEELANEYDHQSAYIRMKYSPETAFARARTAKKEAPEALAGVHADNVMMLVDEASGICEEVFETAEGALTNNNIFVLLISNPTRLDGYFFETHHKDKENWQHMQFDSRESPIVDWQFVERIKEKYGEDSPQWMVRVVGQFPDAEEDQLIPRSLFDAAAARSVIRNTLNIRCLGIDVARYGGDRTAFVEKQGNYIGLLKVRKDQDIVASANDATEILRKARAEGNQFDFVMIDVIGLGAGLFDVLLDRQKNGDISDLTTLIPVNVSETAEEENEHANKRVELWFRLKEYLATGYIDPVFRDDCCSIKFTIPDAKGRNKLEKKEDARERSGQSPDLGDAACLTLVIRNQLRKRDSGRWTGREEPSGVGVGGGALG